MLANLTLASTIAIDHLMIGGLLIICLLLLLRVVKLSAEFQSWLWLTAMLLATLLPLTLVVNQHQLVRAAPVAYQQAVNPADADKQSHQQSAKLPVQYIDANQPQWNIPSHLVHRASQFLMILLVVWFFGAGWRSLQTFRAVLNTRAELQRATPIPTDYLQNIESGYPVKVSENADSPMASGLLSPIILLPSALMRKLTPQQLAPLILHEKAHIQRGDLWFGAFQELIAIVFWWSPVIRWMNHRLHLSREMACDWRAAQQLKSGKVYAQSLVDCARLMLTQRQNILAMSLFTKKKELNQRIEQVLNNRTQRAPRKFAMVLACGLLTAGSISASQNYAPKINLGEIQQDSRAMETLPRAQGEILLQAVVSDNRQVIRALLDNGLDINTPIAGDGTALMLAVRSDNAELAEHLLSLGANVNQHSFGDGNPLIIAAMQDNIPMAELLFNHGADINAVVLHDETPLINASRFGYMDMTRWLIEHGADVNLAARTGPGDGFVLRSPLNMAASQKIRDYLVAEGAVEQGD